MNQSRYEGDIRQHDEHAPFRAKQDHHHRQGQIGVISMDLVCQGPVSDVVHSFGKRRQTSAANVEELIGAVKDGKEFVAAVSGNAGSTALKTRSFLIKTQV